MRRASFATFSTLLAFAIAYGYAGYAWCEGSRKRNVAEISRRGPMLSRTSTNSLDSRRWKCAGDCCGVSRRKRTCLFRDVLFFGGEYYLMVDNQTECQGIPEVHVKARIPASHDGYFWKNTEPYSVKCLMSSNSTRKADLTIDIGLLIGRGTPFNMAHALLDELFPIWDGYFEVNEDGPTADFTIIGHRKVAREFRRRGGFKSEAALEMFSGKAMQFDDEWLEMSKRVLVRKLYVGAAGRASKTVTTDYEMPGRQGSLRAFRDRLLARARLSSSLAQRDDPQGPILQRVMIVKNKRDLGTLANHAIAITAKSGAIVQIVDLAPLSGAQQALEINRASVLVSGVGTALTSCVFMRDGAVLVNVGEVDAHGVVRYWEENIAAGMDWVRVVFYPPEKRRRGVLSSDIADIVHAATKLVDNYPIPVPARANLSPLGKAAACLFDRDPALYNNYMTDPHAPPLDGRCMFSQWAEMVSCQYAGYSKTAPRPCGTINATLLSFCADPEELKRYCGANIPT